MLEKSLYSQKTLFGQNDTFLIESEMFQIQFQKKNTDCRVDL